jgi:hypothetical protein
MRLSQTGRFTPAAVQIIEGALPPPLHHRQRAQLTKIFCEWERNELQEYISMPSRTAINAGIKQFRAVKIKATELSQAITVLDQHGRLLILSRLEANAANKDRFSQKTKRLDAIHESVRSLATLSPHPLWKSGRGRPRNLAAYFVLQDAAAIYEWWSGEKAAREVDRIEGKESGPFFRLVSVLWPRIFGKNVEGLPAAMKSWASAHVKFQEQSPLIANLNLRHPTWRLFER